MSDKVHRFKIYRKGEDGRLVPWILMLDSKRVVVDEQIDKAEILRREAQEVIKSSMGPEEDTASEFRRKMSVWAVEGAENPFPGTEKLREQFFDEVQETAAELGQDDCPGCVRGGIIRKYRKMVSVLLASS